MGVPSSGRIECVDRLEAPRDDGQAAAGRTNLSAQPTDGALVARCRDGDDEAWRELVERFSRYVYAIAVQAFRLPPQDAEDVFQDVFARVYERLDSLREDDAVRPWIAQLTRRLCIDRLRSGGRELGTDVEALADVPAEDVLSDLEDAFDVHEAMAELPENCRQILDSFFAKDESYRTIGDTLGLPAGTIASRISRCLDKLRAAFEGRNEPAFPSGEQVT
ncbi:MAG TPA: sigma-70 family RNA polymerase sigma factor [Gaiellaceae bacterium]|nr:sigma-70 family RNA polymerase sigma factor [Gaiellaceae bacterium]